MLIPIDGAQAEHVVDDDVHDVLVRDLLKGLRLAVKMDCCHPESILDLPYTYYINGDLQVIENNKIKGISKIIYSGVRFAFDGNETKATSFKEGFQFLMAGVKGRNSDANGKAMETRSTDADAISFSGCKDFQTTADAQIGSQATGPMSYVLRPHQVA